MKTLMKHRSAAGIALLVGSLSLQPWRAGAIAPTTALSSEPAARAAEELADILVEGKEPRYVAPTRRDRIGRIWAPVMINGRGPFRLVLDTGASHSAVTAMVALALGIATDRSPHMMMRGVTGSVVVPTIQVDSLSVGDVAVDSPLLPIVPDALGGAEGVLGSEGLKNKRIFIDFRNDQISIAYSRDERVGWGFIGVPFRSLGGQLIIVDVDVGDVRAKAIIDTGGQMTIANLALRDALSRRSFVLHGKRDEVMGATLQIQSGEVIDTPAIHLGGVSILDPGVTYGDMAIFKQWKMTHQPAILIGMDALGLLDTLIIDYRRHELQMRMHRG